MAIVGSMCCCGARVGSWDAIRPFASTRKKACSCARSYRAAAKWWRRVDNASISRRSTRSGDSTSCTINWSIVAGFRTLTVVDLFSREALVIQVGKHLRSEHVVEVLNRLVWLCRICDLVERSTRDSLWWGGV